MTRSVFFIAVVAQVLGKNAAGHSDGEIATGFAVPQYYLLDSLADALVDRAMEKLPLDRASVSLYPRPSMDRVTLGKPAGAADDAAGELVEPKKLTGGAMGQYLATNRAELQEECEGKGAAALMKLASVKFKALSAEEKQPYELMYEDAKKKYEEDMAAFLAAGGTKKSQKRAPPKSGARASKKAKLEGDLELHLFVHPQMRVPFEVPPEALKYQVPRDFTIGQLMDMTEMELTEVSESIEEPHEIVIQVLWNLKTPKKTPGPDDLVVKHFKSGDTFGIFGDCVPFTDEDKVYIPEEQKLPVTILTGFLGAGKTTLLNYILKEQTEKKIAVIENEFGSVSIDDALLTQNKLALAESVVVMDNGCMCCTVRGDLEEGLKQIMSKMKETNSTIDQIIIETTGMADPVPIVHTFMRNRALTEELRLDGVVAVVGAPHILARLDDEVEEGKVNEAYQQVAFSDKMLLNKLDLVSAEEAINVKERLRSINPFAKILPSVKGKVKISEITNMRAHDMTNFANQEIAAEAEDVHMEEEHHHHDHEHNENCTHDHEHEHHENHTHDHDHDHDHDHGNHSHAAHSNHSHKHSHKSTKSRHDNRVTSFSVVKEGEIDENKFNWWLQYVHKLPPQYGTIFRMKGILAIQGMPNKRIFHAVMDAFAQDEGEPWAEGEKKENKYVFIGKSMDKQHLTQEFEKAFVDYKR